ncbi:MAG: hypothetical protein ACKVS6_04110 [Planctomycetota bacterium]
MIKHAVQIGAITVLALASMFYPFMPGTYDRMAVPLSGMAQVLGVVGLVLVPIGMVWLFYELANRRRMSGPVPFKARSYWFAVCALAATLIVCAAVALASMQAGLSLTIGVLMLTAYAVRRAAPAMKRLKSGGHIGFNPTPLYLIIIPGILATAHFAFLKTAVEISRNRTIVGSTPFINAIEAYRTAHGRYPQSLESMHHDYDPPTVGVARYRYEPHGQSYNVFFEQPTWPIGTQEFVMYNPRDEHVMIVHNQDLLESTQEEVDRERNFHARAARDAGVRHWKYFWFD